MRFETIIAAVDGGEPGHRAVLAGRELASLSGGRLILLHVQEVLGLPDSPEEYDLERKEEVEEILRRESAVARELGASVSLRVEKTSASEVAGAIVRVAAEESADVIVMGSRGLSALSAIVVGSNAYKVLHLADRPVLIVH